MKLFCTAEQIFKKDLETCTYKIDGKVITKAVLEDKGKLRWQSDQKDFSGRSHSYARKKTGHFHYLEVKWMPISHCFGKTKPCLLEQQSKKSSDISASSWNVLWRIQKQLFWWLQIYFAILKVGKILSIEL